VRLCLLWPIVAASAVGAQATQPEGRDCVLVFQGSRAPGARPTTFQSFSTAAGHTNDFAGGGVNARCTNTDQRVTSDSAEHFGDQRLLYLIGRVHYTEARVEMTADRVTYYMGEERVLAEGNVVGRTNTGTRFRGPRAVYLRAKAGLRDRSRLDAGGRPDVWISARDAGSDSTSTDSTHVLADSVISDNDSLVYARGKVVIERPDLLATADSAMIDQGTERAALRQQPRVTGRGDRPFALVGTEIDTWSRQRRAERVRANGNAVATSEDMTLKADSIDLRLSGQSLDRAIAWGRESARAVQPDREIVADSIDVQMPGEVLRAMHAVRRARAESVADSSKVRSKERDWLSGDTIVAEFDTTATRRETTRASIRRLVARGSARSWQQGARDNVPAPDSMPAINYMAGRVIDVTFRNDRSLERVRVTDQVTGVLVQPANDTAKAKPRRPPRNGRPR
jgi:lipopolysaccharide export system protein LptA